MRDSIKAAIVSGVSGAGKSTLATSRMSPAVKILELDNLLKALYEDLGVGEDPGERYSYSKWEVHLQTGENKERAVAGFQRFIRDWLSMAPANSTQLLILGNHFVIEEIEGVFLQALKLETNMLHMQRFLLDVEPSVLLSNLHDRRNERIKYGIKKSFKEHEIGYKKAVYMVNRFRTALLSRGYRKIKPHEFVTVISRFLEGERQVSQ